MSSDLLELGAAAIGGKDSMSGTFLDLDVPPTLISFAIAPIKKQDVLSPEFKEAGHPVYVFGAADESAESLKASWEAFHQLHKMGKVKAAWAVERGIGEAVMKMSFGNNIGFRSCADLNENWHLGLWGFLVAELTEDVAFPGIMKIGETTAEPVITLGGDSATIAELYALNANTLEDVYPVHANEDIGNIETFSFEGKCDIAPANKVSKPKVLIPDRKSVV